MHACGNDFVIIEEYLQLNQSEILKITDRKLGIGCDQLLIVKSFDKKESFVDFKIYNNDGSKAETCINGTLCLAWHLMQKHQIASIKLRSFKEVLDCNMAADKTVLIKMPSHSLEWEKIPLKNQQDTSNIKIDGIKETAFAINLGNPHVIFFANSDTKFEKLESFACKVKKSHIFKTDVNVSVCFVKSKNTIAVRTWERGVGQTLCCGSAAICTYIAAKQKAVCDLDLSINFLGGSVKVLKQGSCTYFSNNVNLVFVGNYCNF